MQARIVAVAALVLGILGAPASAQIIATSIPKSVSGTAEGNWAFHVMGSPFAKWRINSYFQDPVGSDTPQLQNSTTTTSASKFIFAAEAAFKAGSDTTVGVGGWYNELGTAEVDFFQFNLIPGDPNLVLAGVAPFDVRVWEVHGNVFYKDFGVQAGLVRNRFRQKGLRAGTVDVSFNDEGDLVTTILEQDDFFDSEPETTNNWDAFLVYKKGFTTGKSTAWGVSLGSGIYRDNDAKSTNFTGFVTGTVGLYKGLGLDASFWYVGASKHTAAQGGFEELIGETVKTDLSRFTAGVSYTFSR